MSFRARLVLRKEKFNALAPLGAWAVRHPVRYLQAAAGAQRNGLFTTCLWVVWHGWRRR